MRHPIKRIPAAVVLLAWATLAVIGAEREIPSAFGPHVNLTAKDFAESKTFTARDRIVGTSVGRRRASN